MKILLPLLSVAFLTSSAFADPLTVADNLAELLVANGQNACYGQTPNGMCPPITTSINKDSQGANVVATILLWPNASFDFAHLKGVSVSQHIIGHGTTIQYFTNPGDGFYPDIGIAPRPLSVRLDGMNQPYRFHQKNGLWTLITFDMTDPNGGPVSNVLNAVIGNIKITSDQP